MNKHEERRIRKSCSEYGYSIGAEYDIQLLLAEIDYLRKRLEEELAATKRHCEKWKRMAKRNFTSEFRRNNLFCQCGAHENANEANHLGWKSVADGVHICPSCFEAFMAES